MNLINTIISLSNNGDVLGTFEGILLPYKEGDNVEISLTPPTSILLYEVVEVLPDQIYINKIGKKIISTCITRVIRVFKVIK